MKKTMVFIIFLMLIFTQIAYATEVDDTSLVWVEFEAFTDDDVDILASRPIVLTIANPDNFYEVELFKINKYIERIQMPIGQYTILFTAVDGDNRMEYSVDYPGTFEVKESSAAIPVDVFVKNGKGLNIDQDLKDKMDEKVDEVRGVGEIDVEEEKKVDPPIDEPDEKPIEQPQVEAEQMAAPPDNITPLIIIIVVIGLTVIIVLAFLIYRAYINNQ